MVVDKVGEPAGKTTQTDTSSNAQSRQVAGAAKRKARARSPSPKTAYPSAFSQRRPLSRMNQTFGPDQTDPSNAIFMPRGGGPSRLRLRDLLRRGCSNQVGLPRRFPDRSRAVVCLRLERRSVAPASRRWAVRRALRRPPAAVRTSSPPAACALLSTAGVSTEGATTIAGTGPAG